MALVLYSQQFSRASVAVGSENAGMRGSNMRRETPMFPQRSFNISTSSGKLQSSKSLRAPVVFGEEDAYLLGPVTASVLDYHLTWLKASARSGAIPHECFNFLTGAWARSLSAS